MPNARLLVVDDEEGMRDMLTKLLSREQFEVVCAENGQRAVDILGDQHFDLVLSDLRMPELDGLGLLEHIQAQKLPVVVMMMSAYVELDTAIEALKLGAIDYVSKPFKGDEVILKVKLALERQRLTEQKNRLLRENAELRARPTPQQPVPGGVIGKNSKLLKIFQTIDKVAGYKSTVLIIGESGTGKELAARSLHTQSQSRCAGPFVPINCGAIPEALLESELFGHAKGAFTDASREKVGLVEQAQGGTLFLDEIAELPLQLQVKLLRFLQEGEIRRVGETRTRKVDVRIVAATARDMSTMVKNGDFREDLYYRLNVLQLNIPPLRQRRDDIPILAEHFIQKFTERLDRTSMLLSSEVLRVLMDYAWPGNIRELENTIERAMVLSDGDTIELDVLPAHMRDSEHTLDITFLGGSLSIKKANRLIERKLIERALEETGGNRTRAAELLEISHRALLYKIKEMKERAEKKLES